MTLDARRTSDEARRNQTAIFAAIDRARRPSVRARQALELGSGSGEHIVALARRFPEHRWQPSDTDPIQRDSIRAWIAATSSDDVLDPIDLDATRSDWPVESPLAMVLAIHLLHMLPPAALETLATAAAERLAPGGLWVLHDAFLDGEGRAPSARMAAFNRALRSRAPTFGLHRRDAVEHAAAHAGLALVEASPYQDDQRTLVYRA